MSDFSAIRNYTDAEVPAVVARLIGSPGLRRALASVRLPRLYRVAPAIAGWIAQAQLRRQLGRIRTVADVQALIAKQLVRLQRDTMAGFTVSGMANVEPGAPYLFISNHRDIVLDSALLNWALHKAGHATSRTAVGDNLMATEWVGDLMRLNKSFVVSRSVTSPKAAFKTFSVTSAFIRESLSGGHSVWIAQRQGRAKDSDDRTDPALLKMLTLAWRDEAAVIDEFLRRVRLIPVAISYELDPCDEMKAHELAVRERTGDYRKAPDEDLKSIALGLGGFKGRVHLDVGQRIEGEFGSVEALAAVLDQAIHSALRLYPTHLRGARELGEDVSQPPLLPAVLPAVEQALAERVARCPADELEFLWRQYATIWRNALAAQSVSAGSSSAANCSRSSSTCDDQ